MCKDWFYTIQAKKAWFRNDQQKGHPYYIFSLGNTHNS